MQIFELYFNTKKENYLAETFQYKPKDVYESKIGRIYLAGEIISPSKNDKLFLKDFFEVLKSSFYKNPSNSPEKSLQSTLVKLNRFIRQNQKTEDLSVAVIASKNLSLYASKIGNIKILLASKGKIIDLGKEVEDGEFNFFSSIIVEKMKKNDKLIVLSSEIYGFFIKNKILEKITKEELDEKLIEEISSMQKSNSPDISGVALIMDHSPSIKEREKIDIGEEEKKVFSFKKAVKESFSLPLKGKKEKKKKTRSEKAVKEVVTREPLRLPSFSFKGLERRPLFLIISLILIVFIGSIIINIERNIRFKGTEEKISTLEIRVNEAVESSDMMKLRELLEETSELKKNSNILTREISVIYNQVEEKLRKISKSEDIQNLELLTKIDTISPNNIAFYQSDVYITSNDNSSLLTISPDGNKKTIDLNIGNGVLLSSPSSDGVALFTLPASFVKVRGSQISKSTLELATDGENFLSLSTFLARPYFLDTNGEIIYYNNNTPSKWLQEEESRIEGGVSLTVDGSIYVLQETGEKNHYFRGEKQNSIEVDLYPDLVKPQKIITTPESPLYVLDSRGRRIIVISKDGELQKQLFHDKIKDVKDFAISSNGKKIYLLTNREVYSLDI